MLNRFEKFTGRGETGGFQQFTDPPIEPLHHAMGLGCAGFGQAMFDLDVGAHLVKKVVACWLTLAIDGEAVSEFFYRYRSTHISG